MLFDTGSAQGKARWEQAHALDGDISQSDTCPYYGHRRSGEAVLVQLVSFY